jgi:hypothetical protein
VFTVTEPRFYLLFFCATKNVSSDDVIVSGIDNSGNFVNMKQMALYVVECRKSEAHVKQNTLLLLGCVNSKGKFLNHIKHYEFKFWNFPF